MAMLPLAPDLFSITTCWPSARDKWSPTTRAAVSAEPPGGNGTMEWIGCSGQSPATAAESMRTRIRLAKGNRIIGFPPSFAAGFGYPTAPASVRPANIAALRFRDRHALFEISSRADGLHQASDARAVRRRIVCRAHSRLHGRNIWHRRHRYVESVVAQHVGPEQAAVQPTRSAEFRDRRGQQWRQARGLVRSPQHPPLRQYGADPGHARLSSCRRLA